MYIHDSIHANEARNYRTWEMYLTLNTILTQYCDFYKGWLIAIIFGTQYTELIRNTIITDLLASPTYCCYTTLGKQVNCTAVVLQINSVYWGPNIT